MSMFHLSACNLKLSVLSVVRPSYILHIYVGHRERACMLTIYADCNQAYVYSVEQNLKVLFIEQYT